MSLFSDSELLNQPIFKHEFDFGKKAKNLSWTPCEKRLKSCLIYMGSKEMIAGALLKDEFEKRQGFNVFISESDGFAEFSGLTPIWHKVKLKGNSRTKKDKSADDYAVMNEFLFKI